MRILCCILRLLANKMGKGASQRVTLNIILFVEESVELGQMNDVVQAAKSER